MNKYEDRREGDKDVLAHFLNKHRDSLIKKENDKRETMKALLRGWL